jgi:uncharacterized protein (DUF1330 family)
MLISGSKVYELALSSLKEQHVDDFLRGYIPRVFPILTEYGGRFLINGTIRNSVAKRWPAKSFAVLEWPSVDQFVRINEDKRVAPLIEMRNRYLDFIMEGCFYRVSEDTDLEIPDNKMMSLLISDRAIPEGRGIRFQWIDDVRNSELSLNLYLSGDLRKEYDEKKDIEELSIQVS